MSDAFIAGYLLALRLACHGLGMAVGGAAFLAVLFILVGAFTALVSAVGRVVARRKGGQP